MPTDCGHRNSVRSLERGTFIIFATNIDVVISWKTIGVDLQL